jgi:uncharacterized protein YbjT (DUF2867 family)
MRILVAGATGTVGKYVLKMLSNKENTSIIPLVRNEMKLDEIGIEFKEVRKVDLTDMASILGCCRDIDVVISTVGLEVPYKGMTYEQVDYEGNFNLLKEAVRARVRKFIYVSVAKADGDDSVELLNAKRKFEDDLKKSGLAYAILRPSSYYKDVYNNFYKMAQSGKITLVGDGNKKLNPIHPEDVARNIIDCIVSKYGVHEIGGPKTYTYNELAKLMFDITDKPAKIVYYKPIVYKLLTAIAGYFKPHLKPVFKFSLWAMTNDITAPVKGKLLLEDYIKETCLYKNQE